ncbi:MAG TPA: single-stranded DNA-binding protein [Chloroflexia bacterium]|nr:single-stranded DNA-binding protein [Chloroflexia bacterium]
MVRGLCKIMLIGNLGKDPEMKYTQQGTPVTNFSMAVTRSFKTADGQTKEETEWFRVNAWRKLAETCNEYLRKGSKVYIEGRLYTREWQTQEGQTRTSVEVEASEMIMLDTKGSGGSQGGYGDERERPATPRGGSRDSDDMDMDLDDLPF